MKRKLLATLIFGAVFSFTNLINVDAALPTRGVYLWEDSLKGMVGESLANWEMQVVGVNLGTPLDDVIASLGQPNTYKESSGKSMYGPTKTITYGGITIMSLQDYRTGRQVVHDIQISNRDATTARGIAVGDSLERVYEVYGQPTYIHEDGNRNNVWFYGTFKPGYSDGISFTTDGRKVTHIYVGSKG